MEDEDVLREQVKKRSPEHVPRAEEGGVLGGQFGIFFFSSRRRHTRSVSAFLLNRSSDLDGTDQTSLGQFSGRVQQTYKHSVPRFFVPEHGTMFTLALVRFPPTATKEIQYLNAKGALTYTDIAGDPVLYGNL